jgi:hypothetical protein
LLRVERTAFRSGGLLRVALKRLHGLRGTLEMASRNMLLLKVTMLLLLLV